MAGCSVTLTPFFLKNYYKQEQSKANEQLYQLLIYAVRFASDPRPVVAVGLNISEDRRTIDSYKIVHIRG